MRRLLRFVDRVLRHRMGIRELWPEPTALFRARLTVCAAPVPLGDRALPAGTQVLELHLWNEHLPQPPNGRPDLAWGKRLHHQATASLRAIAAAVRSNPALHGIQAVGGPSVILSPQRGAGVHHLLERLGFRTHVTEARLTPATFFERLYAWLLLRAFQADRVPLREVLKLPRAEIWMPADELLRRYA